MYVEGHKERSTQDAAESLTAADMQTLSGEHFGLLGNILNQNLPTFVGLVHLLRITQGKSWNFIVKTNEFNSTVVSRHNKEVPRLPLF